MKQKVKQTIEPCSHFKRSHNKSSLAPCGTLKYKRQVREKVLNNRTGRMTYNVSYKEVDRYDDMKDYRVSDFALENLLAINANLSVSKMSMSPLDQADHIVDVLQSKIDNSNS